MSNMSEQELNDVRAVARKIGRRVETDPAFKQQVQQNPKGTLTSAGLPEKYINDFLAEAQLDDVAGYAAKPNTVICIPASCFLWSA